MRQFFRGLRHLTIGIGLYVLILIAGGLFFYAWTHL